jgi:hypothetical protein
LEGYGLQRPGELRFAQCDFPDGVDAWKHIMEVFRNVGPTMANLLHDGVVGRFRHRIFRGKE